MASTIESTCKQKLLYIIDRNKDTITNMYEEYQLQCNNDDEEDKNQCSAPKRPTVERGTSTDSTDKDENQFKGTFPLCIIKLTNKQNKELLEYAAANPFAQLHREIIDFKTILNDRTSTNYDNFTVESLTFEKFMI